MKFPGIAERTEEKMVEFIKEILSYPFITRAFIVGIPVALCAALLGVSLVLRRYSMIGDGLSHVGFGALAVAAAVNAAPLSVAVPVVVIAAFFLLKITENGKMKGDSAVAVISSGALAVGVMVISLSKGMNTDLNNYLFGSILAINGADTALSFILSVAVLILYIVFYNFVFVVTFDENFARATGLHTNVMNSVMAVLTALTVVVGMRLMGAMLISALIIFPSLSSMRIFKTFRSVTVSTAVISTVCFTVGLLISCVYAVPTGACIVTVNLAALVICVIIGKIKNVAG